MTKKREDNLEKLASTVQKILNGNPAILIGSGGSIPYGLPSMDNLSNEIKAKLHDKHQGNSQWESFISKLDSCKNLEFALEKVVLNEAIHDDLIWCIWSIVVEKDISAKNNFLANNTRPALTNILNKFVQQSGTTNIVTTNYDRLIEYAIDYIEGKCCTGFSGGYIRHFNRFQTTVTKRLVNLYKVHGSIDWFKHEQTLFSFRFFDRSCLGEKYSPQVVTPGNRKYKEAHSEPFRTVITKADDALRQACAYLCIGYGFNDEHIQPIIIEENRNKNKPIVIITKDITDKIKSLFLNEKSKNCLIISQNEEGGCIVNCSNSDTMKFACNYWQVDEFYKLWFE